jgi:hypothetical protein
LIEQDLQIKFGNNDIFINKKNYGTA